MKNVFLLPEVAKDYDTYYQTEFGKKVDSLEKEVLRNLLIDVPRNKMLELGCGTGHWTSFFVKLGFEVTGLDNSSAMLKYASERKLNATFLEGNAQNIPFQDESFSVVASVTMLEFVDDQNQVLKEIYRVLKPGGYLLLGCLNADSVLGKNRANDDTFREADFLTQEQLKENLKIFGKPQVKTAVYLTADFRILDNEINKENTEPVFIGALVQKNNI